MIFFIDTVSLKPHISLIKDNNIINSTKIPTNFPVSDTLIQELEKIIKNNLKSVRISLIAVCVGPGSYTSLRIGISVAIGLRYSFDIPVLGFSANEVLLNYSRLKNLKKNICIYVQSLNNQSFLTLYDKQNNQIIKTQKFESKENIEPYFSKSDTILISNENISNNMISNYKKLDINIVNLYEAFSSTKKFNNKTNNISPIYV